MRPKSIIAAFLCISVLLTPQIFAADCAHNYVETNIAATCTNKEQILYTCSLCGDSYSIPADNPPLPGSCYILIESTKSENQLTVTAKLENNPGLCSMRMIFHYNEKALHPVARINGDVWTESECWTNTPPTGNPFSYTAQYSDLMSNNTKNGLVCTLVFDILDETADYGFQVTFDKKPFIDCDANLVNVTVFNIVGKSEYGSHSYEERTVPPTCTENGCVNHVCIYCGDTIQAETIPAAGHQWTQTEVIVSPTFESTGLELYTCINCNETKEEILPVLEHWKKCDLNNDHEVSVLDIVYMRRLLLSIDSPLQMYDAADLDGDGVASVLDLTTLVRIVAGKIPYPAEWDW